MAGKGRASYSDELRYVIRTIFNDLTETYLKEFMNVKYEVLEPKQIFPYSKATASIVLHIGEFFRSYFQEVFSSTFVLPCTDLQKFVKYALSICHLFLRDGFPCLWKQIGKDDIHFILFLMVCAFLAELLYYCLQKDCYRHIKTVPKCLIIAYDRWLRTTIGDVGGLNGLIKYCDNVKPLYDSLPCATASKVMGLHELNPAVKEIKQRIKNCIQNFNRVEIIVSDREMQLFVEDSVDLDNNEGPCVVCRQRCKYHFVSNICNKENSDSSPIRSSEDDCF